MIQVSFDIDNGAANFRDTVRAADIALAVAVAKSRYPDHDVRLALPIDPDTFFVKDGETMLEEPKLTGGRQR